MLGGGSLGQPLGGLGWPDLLLSAALRWGESSTSRRFSSLPQGTRTLEGTWALEGMVILSSGLCFGGQTGRCDMLPVTGCHAQGAPYP